MAEEVKEEEEKEVDNNNKCGLKVLVVDDSPIERTIVERLLKKSGDLFEGNCNPHPAYDFRFY